MSYAQFMPVTVENLQTQQSDILLKYAAAVWRCTVGQARQGTTHPKS